MNWQEFPWSAALTVSVLLASLAMLAMDERLRRKFLTRDEFGRIEEEGKRRDKELCGDIDGIGRKVERNTGLYVALDDRVGDLEEKVSVVEERMTQQWERISEQMNNTAGMIREVTRDLKDISNTVHEQALALERFRRGDV